MARLILIEIPDNADADAFVSAVKNDAVLFAKPAGTTVVDGREVEELTWHNLENAKVEAVWAKPTQFCECDDYAGVSAPTSKFRWMVHAKCAKPRRGANQNPRDLTRPDAKPGEVPYYIGFRADSKMFGHPRPQR
jgi:hypothetical protein